MLLNDVAIKDIKELANTSNLMIKEDTKKLEFYHKERKGFKNGLSSYRCATKNKLYVYLDQPII